MLAIILVLSWLAVQATCCENQEYTCLDSYCYGQGYMVKEAALAHNPYLTDNLNVCFDKCLSLDSNVLGLLAVVDKVRSHVVNLFDNFYTQAITSLTCHLFLFSRRTAVSALRYH